MRRLYVLALAAVLAAAACGPGEPNPGEETATGHDHSEHAMPPDPEGVVVIDNPADGRWSAAEPAPLRFELEQVFGAATEPAPAVLRNIAGAAVGADGNLYVYDGDAEQLIGFSADGTVLWRAGRGGDAPGEFADVRGIAFDGTETIYVVNHEGSALDAWNVDGTYRSTIALSEIGVDQVFMGGFLDADRIALVDNVFEMAANDYIVVNLSADPTIEARFRINAEPMVHVPQGFIFQLSHAFQPSHILVGNWQRYSLRVFDDTGRLHRRVTRDVGYLRPPGFALQGDSTSGINLGGLSAPLTLSSGHWLVYASWPTNVDDANTYAEIPAAQRPPVEWASSLDLFDPDGTFLYSEVTEGSPLPEIGRPWATGPDAALYTVSTAPFPQVRRYHVEIVPPEAH
jgi:hypothetical protein